MLGTPMVNVHSFNACCLGFEPADKYADAPPLVVEIHVDAVAAAGYPLGGALPLIAVLGGGLYESELVTLTAALVAHAVECVEDGNTPHPNPRSTHPPRCLSRCSNHGQHCPFVFFNYFF